MKYTKISSDKAYKIYKEGKYNQLYVRSFCPPFDYCLLSSFAYYVDSTYYPRSFFREREIFLGAELPKVTVRQAVELHCTKGSFFLREDVLKMIKSEHGEIETQYPVSEDLTKVLHKARERTTKYILFDVDSDGNKSNFRFE